MVKKINLIIERDFELSIKKLKGIKNKEWEVYDKKVSEKKKKNIEKWFDEN